MAVCSILISQAFLTLKLAFVYYISFLGIRFSWQMDLCLASWTFPWLSMMVLWQFYLTGQRAHFWDTFLLFLGWSVVWKLHLECSGQYLSVFTLSWHMNKKVLISKKNNPLLVWSDSGFFECGIYVFPVETGCATQCI